MISRHALIEVGFEGGHGTAAGLQGTFEDLGFPEAYDIAVGLFYFGKRKPIE